MEKITVAATLKQYPFLKNLLAEIGVKANKRISITMSGDVVRISPVWCDYYVRYLSWGDTSEAGNVLYGGASDNPQDIFAHGINQEKQLRPNAFFAVVDYGGGNQNVYIKLYIGQSKLIQA